jgi:hypothetical protein
MAVSGVGTTYNLPNYHGQLFEVSPTATPFLSMIGGINGAKVIRSKTWEWQTVGVRSASANNVVAEGAAAPTASEQARSNVFNVTEIHQSKVSVSYSKLAATQQFNGQNVGAEWDDAVIDEEQLQINQELKAMALDLEKSFLSGVYQLPTDNNSNRQTRGILSAITTNLCTGSGAALTTAMIETTLLKSMWDHGAPLDQENTVIICDSESAGYVNKLYSTSSSLSAPTRDRTIGGMAIKTITTIFGTFGVVMDRSMPAKTLLVADLSVCFPVFTEVPNKGALFVEPLAKTGASQDSQLYGEIGLEYGPEIYHGALVSYAAA